MALSKKDLQINITLNELYNTQSLLVQHLDSLVRISFSVNSMILTRSDRRGTTSNISEFSSTN